MDIDIAAQPIRILQEQLNALVRDAIALIPNLVAGVIVLALTMLLVWGAGRGVRRLLRRSGSRASLIDALVKLTRTAIWVVGLLVTATVVFPELSPTSLVAGLGIGSLAIGLAFKDIFENFLAGFLILLRKPMRIGDDIECEGVSGRVEEITIRDTFIRKRSGELVLVPNNFLFSNPLKILTDRPLRRIELVVGIAYGERVGPAREVIRRAVESLESVVTDRPVQVFAREFNSSSVDFLVRWWTASTPLDEHRSRDEVVEAIREALDAAGIEIPFPYRTLTFKEPLELARRGDDAGRADD